jgi:excisionase family DNA binding protein
LKIEEREKRRTMDKAILEKLNKVPEAAKKLALSEKTIWAWIGARRIGVHRIGRSVRISESEIQRILTEGFTPALAAEYPRKPPQRASNGN